MLQPPDVTAPSHQKISRFLRRSISLGVGSIAIPWRIMLSAVCLALHAGHALGQADSARLRWVPNPRVTSGSWVADPARHLDDATRAAIDAIADSLERTTTAELAVAVLDSLDGLEPADAALLLHRRWGVGKRDRDNGIVFLWSPALRRTHVSVGYGLEGVLPDARVGRVQDESVLPEFRRGSFDAGVLAGVRELARMAGEETYSGPPRAAAFGESRGATHLIGYLSALPLVAGAALLYRWRPRRCPRGHGRMRKLGEKEDDAFLDGGAKLEERLGSMNYHIWACRSCDATLIVPRRKWFSRYSRCEKCGHRTVETSERVLKAATTLAAGRKLVRGKCRHCGNETEHHEEIPMITESSGSSSGGGGGGGGGSSFGGGSAGGGGAGRSY